MLKGYKRIRKMWAIPHNKNLSTIINIRDSIAMDRNDSSYIYPNGIDSYDEFLEMLKTDDYICCINFATDMPDELIEVDSLDYERFKVQGAYLCFDNRYKR